MFANLKDKFSETLKNLTSELRPLDENDKIVHGLVDRGTSETLIGPEWSINFQVVDFINQDTAVFSDKALRALRTTLVKRNAKVQLLGLTILEACVKNCHPGFHAALAASDMWAEMLKVASDTSINRTDAEVRDKILAMVEDYGRGLGPHQFKEAYDALIEKGVDFPVRSPEEQMQPYVPPAPVMSTPPPAVVPLTSSTVTAQHAQPDTAAAAAAATATWALQSGAGRPDPMEGMSPEDRAAIAAAMAEMEEEDRAVRAANAAAAAAAATAALPPPAVHPATAAFSAAAVAAASPAHPPPPLASQHASPPRAQHSHQPLALLQPLGAGPIGQAAAAARPPSPAVESAEQTAATLLVVKNSCDLLQEMLSTVPADQPDAVTEPFIAELAEQCTRMRGQLERSMGSMVEEAQLVSALAQHDDLVKVLDKYNLLLAKAAPPAPPPVTAAPAVPPQHHVPAPTPLPPSLYAAATGGAIVGTASAVAQGSAVSRAELAADFIDLEDAGGLTTRRQVADTPPALQSLHHSHGHSSSVHVPPPVPEDAPVETDSDVPDIDAVETTGAMAQSSSNSPLVNDPFISLLGDEVPLAAHGEEVKKYDEQYGLHFEGVAGSGAQPVVANSSSLHSSGVAAAAAAAAVGSTASFASSGGVAPARSSESFGSTVPAFDDEADKQPPSAFAKAAAVEPDEAPLAAFDPVLAKGSDTLPSAMSAAMPSPEVAHGLHILGPAVPATGQEVVAVQLQVSEEEDGGRVHLETTVGGGLPGWLMGGGGDAAGADAHKASGDDGGLVSQMDKLMAQQDQ